MTAIKTLIAIALVPGFAFAWTGKSGDVCSRSFIISAEDPTPAEDMPYVSGLCPHPRQSVAPANRQEQRGRPASQGLRIR